MPRQSTPVLPLTALALALSMASAGSALAVDEDVIESCNTCHGENGVSTEPEVPTIAGFSKWYTADSMAAFRYEERPCEEMEYPSGPNKGESTTMCEIAADIDDRDAEEIGEHYAAHAFVPAEQEFDAALAEKGKAVHDDKCEKCHSEGGTIPDDDNGILAGQHKHYLKEAFEHYDSGERPMDEKMQEKWEDLTAEDKKALLEYYASF